MDAEGRFLESSRARVQSHREKHEQVRQSTEERNKFWESVRIYLGGWRNRLEELERNHGDRLGAPINEEDKRTLHLELSQLKQDLEELRKRSLSSTSINDEGNSNPSTELPSPPDCLTFVDLRLLYDELQKHQNKLEEIKKKLLPKPAFVFKRYRQAVELLRQQGKDLTQLESVRLPEASSAAPRREYATGPLDRDSSTIRDFDSIRIVVDERGSLWVQSLQEADHCEPPIATRQIDVGSSLILREISNSIIELHGHYPAIHMLRVSNTTLHVKEAVSGAIHITDCHQSRVELTAQQLRLHESTDLDLCTSAAVIMEDCRRIRFFYRAAETPPYVKDFSFLKEGVPSPNFVLEPIVEKKPHTLPVRPDASALDGEAFKSTGNTGSGAVESGGPLAVPAESADDVPQTTVGESDEEEL